MEKNLKTGFELLKESNIEKKKDVIAFKLDGKVYDLSSLVVDEKKAQFITINDHEALDILRHSAAHLMAEAVSQLYPNAKFGLGPSIEEGFYYDIDFGNDVLSEFDLGKIENKMRQLIKKDERIIGKEISKKDAKELFKSNEYKLELINEIEGPIFIYTQGEFTDLCSGPHLPSTRYIKHFKLLSLAGAYWRGNSNNKQLTRIYGTAFFNENELNEYLHRLEEAKKRDHRKLGKQLDLFMVSEYGPGFPIWLSNGLTVYRLLEEFWYEKHMQNGYQFVKTPMILNRDLWEVSGHWLNYKDNMYTLKIDERDFAIKPMNCPGAMLVYQNSLHSYKDFPIRMAELGTVHRHEASGALAGLFRVRAFTQDDAHVFLRRDQLEDEIINLLKLFDEFYTTFNLSYTIELSTRPEEKFIGEIALWDESEKILEKALIKEGIPYKINPGDGAFYGPKLDFKLRDSIGRIWQCGTIQLDMNLPERFDLTYNDANNNKVRPVMLHRAIYGSMERFIGILIEHYAGAFPLWLAPTQIRVLPVNNLYHLNYAKEVTSELSNLGFRVLLNDSNEKLGYRLRNAQINKVPYTLVVGDKEVENKTVTYRLHESTEQITIKKDAFYELLLEELVEKR